MAQEGIEVSSNIAQSESQLSNSARHLKQEDLVAWCIVPFDALRRGPSERAAMLVELGIKRCAYDWREEHVPTFEEEFLQYQQHGIELFAFWGVHEEAFRLFEKYDLHPQIWIMVPEPEGEAVDEQPRVAAESLMPLVERTAKLSLELGLYNHGGWGGEPENMVAVCRHLHSLGHTHVGIAYNFHHGHHHIDDWPNLLKQMLPYLMCVNLNGMNPGAQPKILTIGQGTHEADMIRSLLESSYTGPVGIIDHLEHLDSRQVLLDNLNGLKSVLKTLGSDLQDGTTDEERNDVANQKEPVDRDAAVVRGIVDCALTRGNADRGAAIFGSDQTACVSCHQMALPSGETLGGNLGPDLAKTLAPRSIEQMVESLLWPQREVADEFRLWKVLTIDGSLHTGFKIKDTEEEVCLKDTSAGDHLNIRRADVESIEPGGSPMPDGLFSRLSLLQQGDLVRFLVEFSKKNHLSPQQWQAMKVSLEHGPAAFDADKPPIDAMRWPHHDAEVNRERLYDFYTKQAEHFRHQPIAPMLLPAFPGLDKGRRGHWGNQTESTWADRRWNDSILSSVQCGVFRHEEICVTRGICLQLGDPAELYCCFDPQTLSYPAIWQGGFLQFSDVRHGFMDGLRMRGEFLTSHPGATHQISNGQPTGQSDEPAPIRFLGYYRMGARVCFSYMIGSQQYLDAPWVENGQFVTEMAPIEQHSMRDWIRNGATMHWPEKWPEKWTTEITTHNLGALAIDTIHLPVDNSWKAQLFLSGHDFLHDGSALVCSMQGDVWHVTGLEKGSNFSHWKRYAAGLHQPLGLWSDDDGIFVQCRDGLMRLQDLNGDGEADYYESFCNTLISSPAGHDFICDLQRDAQGYFYTASGNQGLVQISPDGKNARVLATGFRNPDGLGILPDGSLTVPCSEGDWTPASMICHVPRYSTESVQLNNADPQEMTTPYFGYGGPRDGQPPDLPMVYVPRGLDNSSGGQATVPDGVWGKLSGQLLHLSYGAGSWFSILVDRVDGQLQGGVVPLAGEFRSGVHRGSFNDMDGHFYVTGMGGWGTYTIHDGCFQRIRLGDGPVQHPIGFHAHKNGILVEFAEALDATLAANIRSHFAQAWNYHYSGAYGSLEYSPTHPGVAAHDFVAITGAYVIRPNVLFLEMPDIQPVNQLHLRLNVNEGTGLPSLSPTGSGHDLFLTIHRLDTDFCDYPDYRPYEKKIARHPILADLATVHLRKKNPWVECPWESDPAVESQKIKLRTGKNLSYEKHELRVKQGQAVQLTLENPDVVPHNWVLVRPGCLSSVGEQVNLLISDPEAYARQYVPDSEEVRVFTDQITSGKRQTIYFYAPRTPGRYPYLCTFPGHWMVMNGTMIVE